MNAFLPADILMPKTDHMEKWAVIACDQFTSDQAYWDRVRKNAEGAVSTINLILPEAELGTEKEAEHTAEINATMKKYMEDGVFTVYPNSFVYVERTLENGSIREGLVGHDRRGVGVDEHDVHARVVQHAARLRAGIVKFSRLAYYNRTRTDNEYLFYVLIKRHYLLPPIISINLSNINLVSCGPEQASG